MTKLKQAAASIKSGGDLKKAQRLIADYLDKRPKSVAAWVWLDRNLKSDDEKLRVVAQ